MAVVVGLLLVAFCIAVALYPLLKSRTTSSPSDSSLSIRELMERRRNIYSDLETLDVERGLGHVDEAEYQERSRDFRLAAAATFRDQELLEAADAEVEDAISRELARWKADQRNGASPSLCSGCGQPLGDDADDADEQCPHCREEAKLS